MQSEVLPSLPEAVEHPTVSVEVAARYLGISRASAYVAAKSGELPTLRIGHRIVVPVAALRRLLGFAE